MHKILGTDDAVNACECCGKSNLKYTVVVDVDGEIMHYGSTCATRHTGKTSAAINQEIKDAYAAKLDAAMREFKSTAEYIAQQVAFSVARGAGLIGSPFRNATRAASDAANAKSVEIAAKHGVRLIG